MPSIEDIQYYFTNYENRKFSYKTAKLAKAIEAEINHSRKSIETTTKSISRLDKDGDFEIKILSNIDPAIQKLVSGIMYLFEQKPDDSHADILHYVVEKKKKDGLSDIDINFAIASAGDYLGMDEFLNYGAKNIAKIWEPITDSRFFRDNYDVGDRMLSESNISDIRNYVNFIV